MTSLHGAPVSPEMERALDNLTGFSDLPEGTSERLAGTADAYPVSIWFNGCYYCKLDETDRWRLQYCSLYRPGKSEAIVRYPRAGARYRRGSRLEQRSR